ncbi:MAG: DEAD/DEAH box helicase [Sphaerochaetaceae bacterium]|nr:DEAD/DEAH box helicase [Sphaerochaetaceae bacterium]
MRFCLHEYQTYAIKYIEEHPVCAIFLDCGLGKTVISLTAVHNLMFDRFEISKVLVIAPALAAKDTWPKEIEKWDHVNDFKVSLVLGTAQKRLNALNVKADIYVIGRDNLKWLVEKSGINFNFDMVILDELSSFKNYQSERFKALMLVRRKIKRIVGLTGTPTPNGLMDLWSQFKLLDLGERLSRRISTYRLNYFQPDRVNGPIVYSYKLLEGAEQKIYDKISDITISMKSDEYLKMPSLVSTAVTVGMDEKEYEKYEYLKREFVLGEKVTASNAAVLCQKLCQLANGCIYSDDKEVLPFHSHKLDAMEEIVEAANGKPVLLVYWYQHDKFRIIERLKKMKVSYEELNSSKAIDMWNKGALQVGLIQPQSAGHGLNLQHGGNHIVWFGLTWSLEFYQQTNARLFRQGQKSDTVVIQHIITVGTIDERILRVLTEKATVQDALVEAVKAELKEGGGYGKS